MRAAALACWQIAKVEQRWVASGPRIRRGALSAAAALVGQQLRMDQTGVQSWSWFWKSGVKDFKTLPLWP